MNMNTQNIREKLSTLGWPCLSYIFQSMALASIAVSTPAPYTHLASIMAILSGIISIGMKGKTFAQVAEAFSVVNPGMGWSRRNEAVVVCAVLVFISGAATIQSHGAFFFMSHAAVIFACLAGWAAINDRSAVKKNP